MDIETVMQRVKASQTANDGIKTAAATQPASAELHQALADALAGTDTTKTASAADAANVGDGLLKIAKELGDAEDALMQKQAQMYGAAVADGFMSRYAQYEAAAQDIPAPKTAGYGYAGDPTVDQIKTAAASPAFTKFANENPELTKEAFELGYQRTWGALEKQAADEYYQGYDETMQQIHKVASTCYKHGAVTINNVMYALQQRANA